MRASFEMKGVAKPQGIARLQTPISTLQNRLKLRVYKRNGERIMRLLLREARSRNSRGLSALLAI